MDVKDMGYPGKHGQKYPQGEKAVKKGKFPGCFRLGFSLDYHDNNTTQRQAASLLVTR